ncbi:MAG: hypothetical protein WCE48_12095 [Steroidobacteraceae bacterium]
MRRFRYSLALLLLAAAIANGAPPTVNLEEAAEIPSNALTLPVSANGVAIFQPCGRCKLLSARATDKSQYFINKRPVSLEALRAAVAGTSTPVVVFYDERSMELTRIKALVQPATR